MRSNQSILKEINPRHSLGGLMLKLKLQYFGHLMQRADLLEKPWSWEILKSEGEGDYRGWDGWMASPIQCTWVWASSERKGSTGKPGVLQSTGSQRVRHDWVTEQQQNNYKDSNISHAAVLTNKPTQLSPELSVPLPPKSLSPHFSVGKTPTAWGCQDASTEEEENSRPETACPLL